MLNDSEYLSSSSSSGDEGVDNQDNKEDDDGTSLTSSQVISGGALSQHMLGATKPIQLSEKRPQMINYTGTTTNPN
jgi:hypothetical protein